MPGMTPSRDARGLRVAIVFREPEHPSLRTYRDNLMRELAPFGVEFIPFGRHEPPPAACDIIWEPAAGSRNPPERAIRGANDRPVIVSVHGGRIFSLPLSELAVGPLDRARLWLRRRELAYRWRRALPGVAAVITPSRYAAEDAVRAFGFGSSRVHAIHHGVDQGIFRYRGRSAGRDGGYFFHVSAASPPKNLPRLLAAYAGLPKDRPPLRFVIPANRRITDMPGVEVTASRLSHPELADMYAGALALVFPSLRETFGLPIIEAMSSGCPVLTSRGTATEEVAGGAALLVDPYSTEEIAHGMARLADESTLREELRARGFERARDFTWEASARSHLEVFQRYAERGASDRGARD